MKLIVLAAGTGSRLWPITKTLPKMLVNLGDDTCLLDKMLAHVNATPLIDELVIVTGYKANVFEESLARKHSAKKIRLIYNPFYEVSNNLMSLWFARDVMRENDFIISNGDNLYFDNFFETLTGFESGIYLTASEKKDYDDDDMKIMFDSNKKIKRVSKAIEADKVDAESVGLVAVCGSESREVFVNTLARLARQKEYLNSFWLESFNVLADHNVDVTPVFVGAKKWAEIDFHPDIEFVNQMIQKKLEGVEV